MQEVKDDVLVMGSMVEKAVMDSVESLRDDDVQSAITVIRRDDGVDGWYVQLYDDATRLVIRDARNIERANYILWVAHHLERLGDRATNICERVVYLVTGERLETSLA